MRTMNLKPLLAYRMAGNLKGMGIFLLALAVLNGGMLAVALSGIVGDGSSSISGSTGSTSILFAFILGICLIREDLRLGIQHGVGRATVYVAELVALIATALILSVVGDLLLTALQFAAGQSSSVVVTDAFQVVYLSQTAGQVMPLWGHVMNILLIFVCCCCGQLLGMCISMGYYHLNKLGTVIVSIVVPLGLITLVTLSLSGPNGMLRRFDALLSASPWPLVVACLVASLAFGLIGWLLVRRAPIRPAQS